MVFVKRFAALSSALVTALAGGYPLVAFAQTSGANCVALIQTENNLWFARANGSPINQVTNDKQPRYAAALSPNGRLIAFSGKPSPNNITLVDESGRIINNISLNAQDAIIGLKWLSPYLIRAEEHYAQNGSKFHFIDLSNSSPSVSPVVAVGTQCAPSPSGNDMACTIAGTNLNLNNRTIYHVTDEFSNSLLLQSIRVADGTSVMTSTSPAFRVDFKGVSKSGRMNLRVTTPDDLWAEQSVSAGGQMAVRFEDDSHPLADYAFKPSLSTPGVIQLDIKKSKTGEYLFEGDVAWDPRGKRIAVVTANQVGERTLLVLNREMGQAADKGNGGIDLQERLPLDGPVRSITFTSNTHIRVVGATQQFDQDIPAQGKVGNGKPYNMTLALPIILNVNFSGGTQSTEVKGWICQ